MTLKKLCIFIAAAAVISSSCCAYAEPVKIGALKHARGTIENLSDHDVLNTPLWVLFRPEHSQGNTLRFYDNLVSALMALNAGEVDELITPQLVGEYMTSTNPGLMISCAVRTPGSYLAFGFREKDGESLQQRFNAALANMKKYGELDALTQLYCQDPGKEIPALVRFTEFPGAETVRVAVTGDFPPIDYIAADGRAGGFNTAILAEIGRRMKVNIKLVQVDTGARTTALMSGRADAVFWYQFLKDSESRYDAPDGVIFSEPYYDWNIFLHIRKKVVK